MWINSSLELTNLAVIFQTPFFFLSYEITIYINVCKWRIQKRYFTAKLSFSSFLVGIKGAQTTNVDHSSERPTMTEVLFFFSIFFYLKKKINQAESVSRVKVNVLYSNWFLYLLFLFNLISILFKIEQFCPFSN